jgi:hypothetical protein
MLGRGFVTKATKRTWVSIRPPLLRWKRSAIEVAPLRITCLLPWHRLVFSRAYTWFCTICNEMWHYCFARSIHCSALNVAGEHTFADGSVAHILFDRLMYVFFTGHQLPDKTFCDIDWCLRGRGKLGFAAAQRGRWKRVWTLEVENGIVNEHPGTNLRGTVASKLFAN